MQYNLEDDFFLLECMIKEQEKQLPIYNPGPYWLYKAKTSVKEIKKHGICSFRSVDNSIGTSYTDSKLIDIRDAYSGNLLKRIVGLITKIYPFSKIYQNQIALTKSYLSNSIVFANEYLKISPLVKDLLKKYNIPHSLLGNCVFKTEIQNKEYSVHYLSLLIQHDHLAKYIDFQKIHSVFEIGGGFGVNIHLLIENYPNIKKILYLDIAPNLYVGTQYLKSFYKDSVKDYNITKSLDEIKFTADDNLEIICITPWQIEKFKGAIDLFTNSNSFVEMPTDVVKNYTSKINNFINSENTIIALTSYDNFDTSTTFPPNKLPLFFDRDNFINSESNDLLNSSRRYFHYISLNKRG